MRIVTLILLAGVSLWAHAQYEQDAAEAIKRNPDMYYGEATAVTKELAKQNALSDLSSNISSVVQSEIRTGANSASGVEEYRIVTTVTSNVRLCNVNYLEWSNGDQYTVLAYILREDLAREIAERRERIGQLVAEGIRQEKELNIAGALKYYYWALNMCNFFKAKVTVNVGGEERDAATWLPAKITSVLQNVQVSVDENSVSRADNADAVNLQVNYAGKPVSGLDINYFDGSIISTVHAKNGVASLFFPDLGSQSKIVVKIQYKFAEEARNYDSELDLAMNQGKQTDFDSYSVVTIPISYRGGDERVTVDAAGALANEAQRVGAGDVVDASTAPIPGKERNQIDRPLYDETEVDRGRYFATMEAIEKAIRTKNYGSVEALFTPEGYALFMTMMRSGKVSVTGKNLPYTLEECGMYVVGKKIPVAVKIGRHTSNENIVMRFDSKSGLVSSVAYGLTQRAENDIFREASWSMDSRYALMQFMEDYQTAFALKRLDYISKIFSDSAIIIVGKFDRQRPQTRGYRDAQQLISGTQNVSYKHYTKDAYINKVERDFAVKRYIQLVFEDCEISLAKTDGLVDNEVIWIAIKQHYISSDYSDVGYLALQINMRPDNSQINVRTWTPVKVPLSTLKQAYPITISLTGN